MIWITVFLTGLIIFIATFIQNDSLRNKYNSDLDDAEYRLKDLNNRFENAFMPIWSLIITQYGERYVTNISTGKICEGMPSELLILSWGEPGDIKTAYYKGITSESWFYHSYFNRLGNKKFRTEVQIENNKIVGWRDLK